MFRQYVTSSTSHGIRTAWDLMVMPRSRSMSMRSRYCARIARGSTIPVICSIRSARVDLPWSMWAMMQKLRMRSGGVACGWRAVRAMGDTGELPQDSGHIEILDTFTRTRWSGPRTRWGGLEHDGAEMNTGLAPSSHGGGLHTDEPPRGGVNALRAAERPAPSGTARRTTPRGPRSEPGGGPWPDGCRPA